MATNNAVNNSLTGQTGTGNFVGSLSPSITNLNTNAIYSAGDYQIVFGNAVSPVNFLQITNGATANPVSISATGTDTNVALYLSGKGSTQVRFGNDLLMYNTAGGNNYTVITTTASGAKTITIPDLSGTAALSGAGQNVNFNVVQTAQINDPNNNPMAYMYAVPSAVNYMQFVNAVTGQSPSIEATGSDANIQLKLSGKGTGTVNIFGTANGTPSMTVQSGPGAQHVTQFQFPATAAGQTVTYPDLTGTVQLSSNTGTAGQVLTSNGTGVAPSYQNAAGGTDAAFGFLLMGG